MTTLFSKIHRLQPTSSSGVLKIHLTPQSGAPHSWEKTNKDGFEYMSCKVAILKGYVKYSDISTTGR